MSHPSAAPLTISRRSRTRAGCARSVNARSTRTRSSSVRSENYAGRRCIFVPFCHESMFVHPSGINKHLLSLATVQCRLGSIGFAKTRTYLVQAVSRRNTAHRGIRAGGGLRRPRARQSRDFFDWRDELRGYEPGGTENRKNCRFRPGRAVSASDVHSAPIAR